MFKLLFYSIYNETVVYCLFTVKHTPRKDLYASVSVYS